METNNTVTVSHPVYTIVLTYEIMPSGRKSVIKAGPYQIAGDKCVYRCQKCGALFQSKNKDERSIFPTQDPKCVDCDNARHDADELERICECEPLHFGY